MPGGGELLIVVIAVVLLFGGSELPRIMRTLGKWTAIFKSSVNDIRREFNRITIEEEIRERDRTEREQVQKMLDQKESTDLKGSDTTGSSDQLEAASAGDGKGKKISQSIEQPVANRAYKFEDEELTKIRDEARKRASELERERTAEGVVPRGSAVKSPPKKKAGPKKKSSTQAVAKKSVRKSTTVKPTPKKPSAKKTATAKKSAVKSRNGSTSSAKKPAAKGKSASRTPKK